MSAFAPGLRCGHPVRMAATGEPASADLVRDVGARLSRAGWTANAVGGLVVFFTIGFLIPVFTNPDERWSLGLLNGPIVLAYFLVSGYVSRRYLHRHFERTLQWITDGRTPDEAEHRMALRLAVRGVKVAALAWAVGALLFLIVNGVAQSWEFGVVVGATVWLGAETTCALSYLVAERVLRPVTARALEARPAKGMVAPGVRGRLAGAWFLGTGVPLLGVVVVAGAGVLNTGVNTEYVAAAVVFLGVVAMSAGLLATMFVSKAIAHPVTAVRRGLEQIERGDLEVQLPVDDGSEVGLLQAGFNRMADGLREREHIRDLFGRSVGEDVAKAALVAESPELGGEEREIGALFVDIVGSTAMAVSMPPTEVVRLLNRFFGVVVGVVEAEGGMVNKFEGDAALCVFGAPVPRDDPAGVALCAARKLAARLAADVPQITFGIGISAGTAVAGNVGAEHRFEYTVIGDPVNEAARLSDLAKLRPGRVLASEAALNRAGRSERASWDVTESAVLRGRDSATGLAHPREHGVWAPPLEVARD
jgi:adenylate cyclase